MLRGGLCRCGCRGACGRPQDGHGGHDCVADGTEVPTFPAAPMCHERRTTRGARSAERRAPAYNMPRTFSTTECRLASSHDGERTSQLSRRRRR